MNQNLTLLMTNFLDNAHIGKIATDFFPGFVLTMTVLLLLSQFTALEVFPFAEQQRYEQLKVEAQKSFQQQTTVVEGIQQKVDRIEAELMQNQQDSSKRAAQMVNLSVLKKTLEREKVQLNQQQVVLNSRQKDVKNSRLLQFNMKILLDNFMSLFLIGYLAGVVLAQVSGKVFYNGFFNTFLRQRYPEVFNIVHHPSHRTSTYFKYQLDDDAFLQRLPNLTTDYYRYLEIAMNMIFPVATLALTLAAIALSSEQGVFGVTFILAVILMASALALFYHARVLYVGYFMKKADVLLLIKERIDIQNNKAC